MNGVWDQIVVESTEAGLTVLSDREVANLVSAIGERYFQSTGSAWWWNSLKVFSKSIDYEVRDGLASLGALLPDGDELILVVTNESHAPAGAIRGTAADLIRLVRSVAGFEFAVVPGDLSWIVFDTHHNALVVAGTLTAAAGP